MVELRYKNPLLDAFVRSGCTLPPYDFYGSSMVITAMKERRGLCLRYAWAVPNDEAINTLAALSPIVEIGAGTGYWASLVAAARGEIECYDIADGSSEWGQVGTFYPVMSGDHTVTALKRASATLLLCWPPYSDPMAAQVLEAFSGSRLVYVGEGPGGCTGDDDFHAMLESGWTETKVVEIPRWPGVNDFMAVYERNREPDQ